MWFLFPKFKRFFHQSTLQMKHSSTLNLPLLRILEDRFFAAEALSPDERVDLPEEVLDELEHLRAALRALPHVRFSPSQEAVEAVLQYARRGDEPE